MMSLFSYVGALISLTMIYAPPWNWNISKQSTQFALSCIITTPFKESIQIYQNCSLSGNYHAFIKLVGGNIIMLMPLGIIVPILYPKYNFIKMLLLSMLTSFLIELSQLTTNILLGQVLRTVEIDDFIQNVFGCMVAYFIYILFRKVYRYIIPTKSIT